MKFSHRIGFLPIAYIKKNKGINDFKEKRALSILMVASILLFPINLSKFLNIKNNNTNEIEVKVTPEIFIDKKDILLWVELSQKTKGNITVTNGDGSIRFKSLKNIKDIEEIFEVENISSSKDGYTIKFKRGITYEK